MFKRLFKNKKAQNTAEYAILISLVVAAVIAMQTYAQRALQGRIRDASQYMATQTNGLGNTTSQYEAYYQKSTYDIDRTTDEVSVHNANTISVEMDELRRRKSGGQTETLYNGFGLINGL